MKQAQAQQLPKNKQFASTYVSPFGSLIQSAPQFQDVWTLIQALYCSPFMSQECLSALNFLQEFSILLLESGTQPRSWREDVEILCVLDSILVFLSKCNKYFQQQFHAFQTIKSSIPKRHIASRFIVDACKASAVILRNLLDYWLNSHTLDLLTVEKYLRSGNDSNGSRHHLLQIDEPTKSVIQKYNVLDNLTTNQSINQQFVCNQLRNQTDSTHDSLEATANGNRFADFSRTKQEISHEGSRFELPSRLLAHLGKSDTVEELASNLGLTELLNPPVALSEEHREQYLSTRLEMSAAEVQSRQQNGSQVFQPQRNLFQRVVQEDGDHSMDTYDNVVPSERSTRFLMILLDSINVTTVGIVLESKIISNEKEIELSCMVLDEGQNKRTTTTTTTTEPYLSKHQKHSGSRVSENVTGMKNTVNECVDEEFHYIRESNDLLLFTRFRTEYYYITSLFVSLSSLNSVLVQVLFHIHSLIHSRHYHGTKFQLPPSDVLRSIYPSIYKLLNGIAYCIQIAHGWVVSSPLVRSSFAFTGTSFESLTSSMELFISLIEFVRCHLSPSISGCPATRCSKLQIYLSSFIESYQTGNPQLIHQHSLNLPDLLCIGLSPLSRCIRHSIPVLALTPEASSPIIGGLCVILRALESTITEWLSHVKGLSSPCNEETISELWSSRRRCSTCFVSLDAVNRVDITGENGAALNWSSGVNLLVCSLLFLRSCFPPTEWTEANSFNSIPLDVVGVTEESFESHGSTRQEETQSMKTATQNFKSKDEIGGIQTLQSIKGNTGQTTMEKAKEDRLSKEVEEGWGKRSMPDHTLNGRVKKSFDTRLTGYRRKRIQQRGISKQLSNPFLKKKSLKRKRFRNKNSNIERKFTKTVEGDSKSKKNEGKSVHQSLASFHTLFSDGVPVVIRILQTVITIYLPPPCSRYYVQVVQQICHNCLPLLLNISWQSPPAYCESLLSLVDFLHRYINS